MGLLGNLFGKNKTPEEKPEKTGPFVGFVLLDDASFDADALLDYLREDWGIAVDGQALSDNGQVIVSHTDGMSWSVGLMAAPIPNGEAEQQAQTNYQWPEAVEVTRAHKGHLLVAILPLGSKPPEAAILFAKVCSSCLKLPNATGLNTLGTVFEPEPYIQNTESAIKGGEFPIASVVFFGIYSRDGRHWSGYTYGLLPLGRQELEILDSGQPAEEVYGLLIRVALYLITDNVTLKSGETLGYTAEQKLPISLSDGVAVSGKTFKITF